MEVEKKNKIQKVIVLLLGMIVIGLQLKCIFTELNSDTEYSIAMSWRMIQGDRLFFEMWEPHQTSAFLMALLMRLYMAIFSSNEGIIVFLNLSGVLIHGGIVFCTYNTLKDRIEPFLLKLLCLLLMVLRPKGYVIPEFSNMLVWFSLLLLLCMVKFLDNDKRKFFLVLASVCLCLQIISYPSCIINYFIVVGIIWFFSQSKWKNILIFSCSCALQGGVYVLYLTWGKNLKELMDCVGYVFSGDRFHGEQSRVYGGMLSKIGEPIAWVAGCFLVAYIIEKVYWRLVVKKKSDTTVYLGSMIRFMIFSGIIFGSDVIRAVCLPLNVYDGTWLNFYFPIFILYFIKAIGCLNYEEKKLVGCAYAIAAGSLVAVCLVTNLSIKFSVQYIVLAIFVSYIPMLRYVQQHKMQVKHVYTLLTAAIVILAFKGCLDIKEIGGIIKSGPAKGIVTEYMRAYRNQCDLEEWERNIENGDSILLVGQDAISAIGYLNGDTVTAAHSTMCNPTYNETMLEYWKLNPEKYPDVIVVDCWYGDLRIDEDSWIMQWILSEYQPSSYIDGSYYRFYRLEK